MQVFHPTQANMFTAADEAQHSFFVAKDKYSGGVTVKTYTSFPDLSCFIDYYRTIPLADRHFYELIRKDYPFCEYYDLDVAIQPDSDKNLYNNETLFRWFEHTRSEFLKLHCDPDCLLTKPNWVVLTASDHTKLSLHLINTNAIFFSTNVFKTYYREFQTHYNSFCSEHPFGIDWSVSSNNRVMRIIDSTKLGSNRRLSVWTEYHNTNHIKYEQTFITNASDDPDNYHKWVTTDMFMKPDEPTKTVHKPPRVVQQHIEHTHEGLNELLGMLKTTRADSYTDWISIGMALKHTNADTNLAVWKKWSSISSKYDEDVCERTWNGFQPSVATPITLGTVHYYARQDNPEAYHAFVESRKRIKIDLPFTPDLKIHTRFIPDDFYTKHVPTNSVLALRSNMFTGKTYGMPTLFQSYPNIVVVYQRVSLNVSIYEKWQQYGFELYSNIDDYVIRTEKHPRVIIQVDSLPRLHGKCDLLILDEIESVHEHLCGSRMINNTSECWKAFSNYIKYTPRIIACDATLKDETCDLLFRGKTIRKIENTYKSFKDLTCTVYLFAEKVIDKLFSLLEDDKRVVVPTNSKSRAKKIEKMILRIHPDMKVLRIDNENGFVSTNKWSEYTVVIYTPTVTAGISFDKHHFHALCGFFGRNSTSAEQSAQMLFRVRTLIDQEMHLYTDRDCTEACKPVSDTCLTEYIQATIKTTNTVQSGIDIDRFNNKAKENAYFKLYRLYLKKNHLSFTYFRTYLLDVLKAHGIKIMDDQSEFNPVVVLGIKNSMQDISREIKIEDASAIVHADPLTSNDYYELMNSRRQKTPEENDQIKRYVLCMTFDKPSNARLSMDWVRHNIPYLCYRNYKTYANMTKEKSLEDIQGIMEGVKLQSNHVYERLMKHTNEASSSDDEDDAPYRKKQINKTVHGRIHFDKTYHKIYHCLQFVYTAGFSSLKDEERIRINYEELHQYCKDHEEDMRVVFGSKIMRWKEVLDGNEKNALSKFINQKLEAVLGIRLTPTSKGSSMKYIIHKLFIK